MGKWSLFVQVRRSHDVAFINKWQLFVTYTSGGNKAFDPVWANPRASNTMTKWVAIVLLVAKHTEYNLRREASYPETYRGFT